MKMAAFGIAAMFAQSACSSPTPYQRDSVTNPTAGGYNEQQIETNRWKIEFSGNSPTSRDIVERYLLLRAAQLTRQQGYDWFGASGRNVHRNNHYYSEPDPFFAGWPGSYWHLYRGRRLWGGGHWGVLALAPVEIQQITSYDATIEIAMGHGPKLADPSAYAAEDVISHLQTSIHYPPSDT